MRGQCGDHKHFRNHFLYSARERIDVGVLQHALLLAPRRHLDHGPANIDSRRHMLRQQPLQQRVEWPVPT